ncbi:transcription initiation factor TFIID subunit 4-like [Pristis pectinata]|uniref:transcription initiation factor TFIID subunit 4-like n=1 Tax=Pristis pectinata TaxID=685728 RepID=UPI00223E15A2|nr:transcription initiation factor TFIID subunit 4-like [Pristis pectinata]
MAAGPDPLAELLLSEVDEKAVSDLVGSLEWQLAGGGDGASPQGSGRPGPAAGSASADAQQRLGGMAPSGLGEAAAAAPASGFGRERPAGHRLSPGAAVSSDRARAPAAETPGTRRPPPPSSPAVVMGNPALGSTSSADSAAALGLATVTEPPLSAPVQTPHPLPQTVNGLVGNGSLPAPAPGSPHSTGNHLPISGTTGHPGPGARTELTATSSSSTCNSTQTGSLTPQFVPASQTSGSIGTPTIALHRPPADVVSANSVSCIVSSQNGVVPLNNVNASGLLQVGSRSAIRPGTTVTHFISHPISSPGATNTDSTSQTKLVLHTQSQPVTLSLLNNTAVTVPVTNPSSNPRQCTVTNTLSAVGSTLSINALPKASVNVITQPHITKVVASTQSTVQGSAARLQPPRPGMGPPQRIFAPQFIIRPQYQPTVQLASGFTIPSGMILVQTESGQLIMVPQQALVQAQAQQPGSISPRPSAPTSAATIRLASNQQAMSLSSIRPVHPLQAKVIQPAALVNAPSVTIAQPIGTVAPMPLSGSTSTPQTLHTTTKLGVSSQHPVMSEAAVQTPASPQTPQLSQPASKSQLQVHSQVTPSSPQAGTPTVSQEMQENVKKCKNFLATLIKLASHSGQSADTSRNVKSLVQDLLDTKIEPEEFTNRLQSELKSSPQPYLVPFLKKSLPALRQSLVRNQQCVLQLHQQPQHLQAVVPTQAISTLQSETTVTTVTSGPSARIRQPGPVSAVTGTSTVTHAHINLTRQGKSARLIVQSPVQTLKRQSVGLGTQVRLPMVITPSIRPVVKSQSVQGIKGLPESLQFCTSQKTKLNDSGGGSFRDDDDINDVASMAGLNLNEENANILATNSEFVGTNIHSCKDEAFLASGPLHRRILETAKRFGITDVPIDIVNTVSHATQERLKTVIGKLTTIAQHRMETHKDHEWYEQATDVRTQLKFFEHLERLEKQRKDDQEREILLKAAKSRSRQEDPEQARLKQKAKEMQQQELAQMRQRDANLTALAAIGPRKKRRLDSPGPQAIEVGLAAGEGACLTSGAQTGFTPTSSRQYARQKVTRVNLRDFIFYMEQERDGRHSLTLYRALLK